MPDLRDRLVAARLASDNVDSDGVADDDAAADAALDVFAEWLRERADAIRVAGGETAVAEWAAKRFYDAADEIAEKGGERAPERPAGA